MVHRILALSLLLLMATSAAAVDQIVPVTATNYPSGPFGVVVDLVVTVPVGAVEITGWTGRVQTGQDLNFVQLNWYHDGTASPGGAFHWLDGQHWPAVGGRAMNNATPGQINHHINDLATPTHASTDIVLSKLVCSMVTGSPNCFGWTTFYFRVP